jgi:hypothetical protein
MAYKKCWDRVEEMASAPPTKSGKMPSYEVALNEWLRADENVINNNKDLYYDKLMNIMNDTYAIMNSPTSKQIELMNKAIIIYKDYPNVITELKKYLEYLNEKKAKENRQSALYYANSAGGRRRTRKTRRVKRKGTKAKKSRKSRR